MSNLFSSLVITLREGIEAALAIGIVLLYLRKTGRRQLAPAVWWGLGLAVLASLAGAWILNHIPLNGEILEGSLMFVAAVFVGTMILWMWKSARGLKKEIENRIEEIASSEEEGRAPRLALFLFTFLMIVREGMETVIFLSAVNLTTDAILSFLGGILGLALAVLFGIFFVRGSLRIDLGRFFKITGIVLLLFVLQLLIGGVHELSEGGVFDIGREAMAVVGPIVKNNALFLIGILLIPVLMLLIPSGKTAVAEAASRADQRLLLAQQKRVRTWRVLAASLSIVIVLFIAWDFVYGQNKREITPPVPVSAQNGEVRIALSQVSDGNLHRFILEGSPVRFIVMQVNGKVLTAFDACEICGSQGYIQEGSNVVCLNCSAEINTSTLGQGGGCNPVKLVSRVSGSDLVVRFEDIKKEEARFAAH
ncbi:MAG TPA: Fe-S-containing protein [Acidobacteriota bacterium]|nr:Fe-S-containing protein [Acidobacteriota bacterium]